MDEKIDMHIYLYDEIKDRKEKIREDSSLRKREREICMDG